jgi:hypothetical protein
MSLPKRIIKETERLVTDSPPGISASPHEDNLRYFDVTIAGPDSSPYEGPLPSPAAIILPDPHARRPVPAGGRAPEPPRGLNECREALPPGPLSDGTSQGPMSDQGLPPQHRQDRFVVAVALFV